ncbi:CTP synthase (glutamine hydrolyzing) [bacterium]|nr:CTP synthase (glutamine hydrolyzing) [bacterium]
MNNQIKKIKYIVVTGGVISGIGKGIAAASIGSLLCDTFKVVPVKCDGYLNTDPGTMNPIEHGEVFVLDDGGEVDMDFGHYERFLNISAKANWNLTMGKVFKQILDRERRGDFLGKTVQFVPHVTQEIKDWIQGIANNEQPDVMLIEVGGTVGDLENQFYLEAIRQLGREVGRQNMLHVHLTYVPIPSGVGEQKTKPTQMSVRLLNEKGIEPDIIIGRCSEFLTPTVKAKIASYCNVNPDSVISGIDVDCIYEVPLVFAKEGIAKAISSRLDLKINEPSPEWRSWVKTLKDNRKNIDRSITIALCGKYTALEDSYASIIEALQHCQATIDCNINLRWIETTSIESNKGAPTRLMEGVHGIIVPGGFGTRGTEGKIEIINYARKHKIPFLGICYGMQLAVIEFARNVCGLTDANTNEVAEDGTKLEHPVVAILPSQQGVTDKGGTMRLGGHNVAITPGTKAYDLFDEQSTVRRRFRHRYEINPAYIAKLESAGLLFSGKTPDGSIMQMVELPDHPYFVASQFHPELTSSLHKPSPMFAGLIKAALKFKQA